jgi:hypothetical protein
MSAEVLQSGVKLAAASYSSDITYVWSLIPLPSAFLHQFASERVQLLFALSLLVTHSIFFICDNVKLWNKYAALNILKFKDTVKHCNIAQIKGSA